MFQIIDPEHQSQHSIIGCTTFSPLAPPPIIETKRHVMQRKSTPLMTQPCPERLVQMREGKTLQPTAATAAAKKSKEETPPPRIIPLPMTYANFCIDPSWWQDCRKVSLSFCIKAKAEPLLDETFKVHLVELGIRQDDRPQLIMEYAWTDSILTCRDLPLPPLEEGHWYKVSLEGPGTLQAVTLHCE